MCVCIISSTEIDREEDPRRSMEKCYRDGRWLVGWDGDAFINWNCWGACTMSDCASTIKGTTFSLTNCTRAEGANSTSTNVDC